MWLAVVSCSPVATDLLAEQNPRSAELQAALDAWAAQAGHHGVSASVIFADGSQWTGVAGTGEGTALLRSDQLIWVASITKTMTGAVILQLAEESKLSLDDPIARWLKPIPNVNPRITIRQLLNHTSGVNLYDGGALIAAVADPGHVFTADELLSAVGPPLFAPGTGTHYTNTAFVLLARIAEEVTGKPIEQLYHERLWGPLGLKEVFFAGHEPPAGPVAVGYWTAGPVQPLDDLSRASAGHGAGSVFATARTVAQWGRALFTSKVVSPATQEAMRTLVPAAGNIPGESGAGLGIRGYNFLGRQEYGHSGGAVLASSLMVYDPATNVTVAVLVNQGTGADHFLLAPKLLQIASRR